MTTSRTPQSITDLQYMDYVINVKASEIVEQKAIRAFRDILNDERDVTVRHLFTEEGKKVFEAYTDSGSVDYIYLVK